ncbi:MAG TPA: hypothetical protein VGB53_06005 [Rubricoccaceae bacterium]|jgi:hypothetical protein
MSTRFSFSSAALLLLVLAAPAFTAARIAEAFTVSGTGSTTEAIQALPEYSLPEVVIVTAPYDPAQDAQDAQVAAARVAAARVAARTTRPA